MDRLTQKNELLVKLGMLFGPLQRLADRPDEHSQQERDEIIARYSHEFRPLLRDVRAFSLGQPGQNYQNEYMRVYKGLHRVLVRIERGRGAFSEIVSEQLAQARDAIHSIPVAQSSTILDAGSPFTAYCKIRSLCEADAVDPITWFDAYFGPDVFHRYLQFTPMSVAIVLIAAEPGGHAGKGSLARWNAFLDVSRLFAQEKGPDRYRLLVAGSLHDRWLMLDGKRISRWAAR